MTALRKPSSSPYVAALAALEQGCPDRVEDSRRWQQACADARRFLAEWGAEAERLGWSEIDLFSLHPTAPLSRYDQMGLIWLLRGEPVLALSETEAAIRTHTGGILIYQRGATP